MVWLSLWFGFGFVEAVRLPSLGWGDRLERGGACGPLCLITIETGVTLGGGATSDPLLEDRMDGWTDYHNQNYPYIHTREAVI